MAWYNLFKLFDDNKIELVGNFIFTDLSIVIVIRYISPNFNTGGFTNKLLEFVSGKLEPPSLYFCSDVTDSNVIICSEPVGQTHVLIDSNSFITFYL